MYKSDSSTSWSIETRIVKEIITKESIFIDFDGCLTYNGLEMHNEALSEVIRRHTPYGIKIENDKIPNTSFEKNYGELFPKLFGMKKPESKEALQAIIKEHLDLFDEKTKSGKIVVNKKIQEVIAIANKYKIPTSILSMGKTSYIKNFLDYCKIFVKAYDSPSVTSNNELYLEDIYAADHILRCDEEGIIKLGKTDFIEYYAKTKGIDIKNCLMFDDTKEVIEEMTQKGIPAIYVKSADNTPASCGIALL